MPVSLPPCWVQTPPERVKTQRRARAARRLGAAASGNTHTLVLNMSFTPALGGNRVIYTAVRDMAEANNSGWQSMGTWTVE